MYNKNLIEALLKADSNDLYKVASEVSGETVALFDVAKDDAEREAKRQKKEAEKQKKAKKPAAKKPATATKTNGTLVINKATGKTTVKPKEENIGQDVYSSQFVKLIEAMNNATKVKDFVKKVVMGSHGHYFWSNGSVIIESIAPVPVAKYSVATSDIEKFPPLEKTVVDNYNNCKDLLFSMSIAQYKALTTTVDTKKNKNIVFGDIVIPFKTLDLLFKLTHKLQVFKSSSTNSASLLGFKGDYMQGVLTPTKATETDVKAEDYLNK